ncbi:ABC transporter ATP-binding protein [Thermodesulfatator atlanticus]|uniref:ABC transporter ATP-binding protein n=1 Tax=Thermodesulfatator atlanticus TaxID=501497 RepID=UPI0003B5B08A|nr:ABC transporter ATP-binding protein [Thermodesulfatator atlanticus]
MTVIEVKALSYRYPKSPGSNLKDISFAVRQGEIFLLAGETGSGKSTLISVLCGLIPHEAGGEFKGLVKVLGKTWPISPVKLFPEVTVVFQSPAEQLLADTVFAEVAFGLENLGLSKEVVTKRVKKALAEVGLSGYEAREISSLSGGERQRVAIAQALAVSPKLLLLDEPLSQLDPMAAQTVMGILKRLASQGMTIVIAEHRLEYVLPRVDRLLYLEEGRPKFLGKPKDFTPPKKEVKPLPSPPKGQKAVEIKNLYFSYPKRPPLFSGLNFSFYQDEKVALLGPNGSGKTTFLHLLAGLKKPVKGEIRYLLPQDRKRLALGLLLQDPDLMLIRTKVAEELSFSLENLGFTRKEIEPRVSQVAKMLHLFDKLKRAPFSLSRGERLRVALGALLTGRPQVLLLDEPTTAQDPQNALRLFKAIGAELVVFSTHDEDLAYALATRILRFEKGKIEEETR